MVSTDYDIEQVVNAVWRLEDSGRKVTVKAVARRLRRWDSRRLWLALYVAWDLGSVRVEEDGTLYLS